MFIGLGFTFVRSNLRWPNSNRFYATSFGQVPWTLREIYIYSANLFYCIACSWRRPGSVGNWETYLKCKLCTSSMKILWRIDPLSGNVSVNRTSIARQLISKHAWNYTGQQMTMFSAGSAPRLYNEKFEGSSWVVKKCVEFWKWQSKVIEKK
jgi:hypothetical protein